MSNPGVRDVFAQHKDIVYVLIGNLLTYFDVYLYIHLAHIIHGYYFVNAQAPLLNLFTLANIYLLAPLGCLVFAYLGDTLGRKKIIVSSSLLMAFCSSLIGLLPTYQDIGMVAGVLLITLRVLQGVALSGEPIAALLYLIESTSSHDGPLAMVLRSVTEILAVILALGVAYSAITFFGEQNGWRLPFYLSTVFCFFSLWLRWHLAESKEYLAATTQKKGHFSAQKTLNFLKFYRSLDFKHPNLLCLFGLSLITGLVFVFSYVYLGKFLMSHCGMTAQDVLLHNLKLGICEIGGLLFFYGLGVGLRLNIKKFLVVRTVFFLFLLPCLIYWVSVSPQIATVFMLQLCVNLCLDKTLVYVSLIKVFSVVGRFSLVGTVMSFAKIASFLVSSLIFNPVFYTRDFLWFMALLGPMALIFLLSLVFYIPYEKQPILGWSQRRAAVF